MLPLCLFTILLVITRSPITRSRSSPPLESAPNLEIEADKVYIGWTGRLVLHGVTCRIPGLAGPAGQVFQAEQIRASLDWAESMAGNPTVREVEFIQPVVRVSQSVTDSSLNVEAFSLDVATARHRLGEAVAIRESSPATARSSWESTRRAVTRRSSDCPSRAC